MKNITKTQIMIPIMVLMIIFYLPTVAKAQPGFEEDTRDVPVDGGLSLLVAAGVAYGSRKLKKNKPE